MLDVITWLHVNIAIPFPRQDFLVTGMFYTLNLIQVLEIYAYLGHIFYLNVPFHLISCDVCTTIFD